MCVMRCFRNKCQANYSGTVVVVHGHFILSYHECGSIEVIAAKMRLKIWDGVCL